MKFQIIIFLFFVMPVRMIAQTIFDPVDYQLDTNKLIFGIRSEAVNNSNAFTSNVLNTTLYGGYITEDDKNQTLKRTHDINSSGAYWNSSIFFVQRIDSLMGKEKRQLSYFVNIADRQEYLTSFSENSVKLLLNGNKQFAGQSVSLTPLNVEQIHYSQFQFGLNKTTTSGNFFSIGLSFLYGQTNLRATSERLDLLVSENGDRISADTKVLIHQSELNNANFMNYNGAGASIDLVGKFKVDLLKDSTNKAIFHFSITNLGVINWHGSSQETRIDTFYTYNGVYIENIFDPSSKTTGDNPASVIDSIATVQNLTYTSYTPATIRFYLEQQWQDWTFTLGGAHRFNGFYFPYVYVKSKHEFNQQWALMGQINYGGYGNLGGGMEIQYSSGSYQFRVGSSNLEGFIAPSKIAGQSVYLLLKMKI